jgi:transposase-like protein
MTDTTAGTEINCPCCGSPDVCQDYITLRPVKTYGWVCDHCEHTWNIEIVKGQEND